MTTDTMNVDYRTVEAVDDSWRIIRQIPNYEQVAGEILFRKIFELAPAALGLYQFGSQFQNGTQDDDLYRHPVFVNHAKGVVQMLDLAINLLGPDMEPVTVALQDLGARHTEYGVLPAHYDIVGQALLYTLEAALGKDQWTETVQQGWVGVYTYVSTAMMEGAETYLKEKLLQEQQDKEGMEQEEVFVKAQSEEALMAAKARAMQSARKKAAKDKAMKSGSLAAKNQLPVVKRSRQSLNAVLLNHKSSTHPRNSATSMGSEQNSGSPTSKPKKVPNSRIQDRGLAKWLNKALKIRISRR